MAWSPAYQNGLWVWYMGSGEVIEQAAQAGYNYLLIKAGDGNSPWSQFNTTVIEQCHNAGLACVAWTYNYLDNPGTELAVALHALDLGADGLVCDVEYEAVGRVDQGRAFVQGLLEGDRGKWLGYSPDFRIAFGNRWPSYGFNPGIEPWPWDAFNRLDGVLPQLYWTDFNQSYQTTLDMVDLWIAGCEGEGWAVPPVYPVFPSTASATELIAAADYAKSKGITGANVWRQGSGSVASQYVLGWYSWGRPEEGENDEMLVPYIQAMGSEEGEIVKALDAELAKRKPDPQQIRNIRNRLVALRNEALGD